MKTYLPVLVMIMGVVMVSGCKEETKSKEWFKEHPKETVETYQKCQRSGDDSDNCKNAKWSYQLIEAKKMAGLPTGL